ncbi:MAG: hypothetical protein HKN40_07015 [Winogradskyella sp.]|uniref:hypothetical protein n=1 Tax=Winogradskyella sp. TaxID=1883156 RepID=UPI0017E3EC57|nr:hypothetical protein [Winogradskyella sp.]
MKRRTFLSAFLVPFCWRQQDGVSIDELEVLAEEYGNKWLDLYLERVSNEN